MFFNHQSSVINPIRQCNDESRSPANFTLDRNAAPMTFHNSLADAQTDARALIFASAVESLKGLEDAFSKFLLKSDAVVLNNDLALLGPYNLFPLANRFAVNLH